MSNGIKEHDLYHPVKKYFETQGFSVYGEVKGCDLIAQSDEVLIAVELKLSVSLKLIFQVMERKKITPLVYAAVPRPKSAKSKHYRNSVELFKSLGVGLLIVAIDSPVKIVEAVLHPDDGKKLNTRKLKAVKQEISGRTADYNKGGLSRQSIITAYRERSVKIAVLTDKNGYISLKALSEQYGEDKSAGSLMRSNVYGWFERVEKGVYRLSETGRSALLDQKYTELIEYYKNYNKEIN